MYCSICGKQTNNGQSLCDECKIKTDNSLNAEGQLNTEEKKITAKKEKPYRKNKYSIRLIILSIFPLVVWLGYFYELMTIHVPFDEINEDYSYYVFVLIGYYLLFGLLDILMSVNYALGAVSHDYGSKTFKVSMLLMILRGLIVLYLMYHVIIGEIF